jgi:hypothetical protein
MITTALTHLYTMPPLAAAITATVGILWSLTILGGALQLLATVLDRPAVLEWTAIRLRYIVAWTHYHYRRWRDGTQCRVPPRVIRVVGARHEGFRYGPLGRR